MERVQEAIKDILETYLDTELAARESIAGYPTVTLPEPASYWLNFHDRTVIAANQYPAVILLPGDTRVEEAQVYGYKLNYYHSLAIVVLLQHRDLETLQRMRVRYAEAIIAALKKHQKEHNMLPCEIREVSYDRVFRDEENAPYLSSVWVMVEVREQVTLS